jgi:hypothetical protein
MLPVATEVTRLPGPRETDRRHPLLLYCTPRSRRQSRWTLHNIEAYSVDWLVQPVLAEVCAKPSPRHPPLSICLRGDSPYGGSESMSLVHLPFRQDLKPSWTRARAIWRSDCPPSSSHPCGRVSASLLPEGGAFDRAVDIQLGTRGSGCRPSDHCQHQRLTTPPDM